MANPEHIAKLNAGVHAWNKWREENPVLGEDLRQGGAKELEQHKIDLRHARLEKRDLRGFDLSFADLHRACTYRELRPYKPHPCGTLIADLVDALSLLASTAESKRLPVSASSSRRVRREFVSRKNPVLISKSLVA